MRAISANDVTLHIREDGDPNGAPVVFSNSLGTDLRLWDHLLPLLPAGLRFIRYDTRGHGLSDCPAGPYSIADLSRDAEALVEGLGCGPVTFVGLSIGGMIGQSLAARRPDLIRALVLSNTAARMGTPEMWQQRIATLREGGISTLREAILDRWFGPAFRHNPEVALWGAMLDRTPLEGYLGCCAAIAEADLSAGTAALNLPTLAIAGSQDGASPPDLVAATAALIAGARCEVIEGAGHLPCAEDPAAYAAILSPFLEEHANV
ncbi:3-oxoadipate enol-lactonase [Phaeobacter sp. HF9A]|uniref:3-oxoadipate enol-lactonase n=1 Tax=Phaeobacter sp. HF9A TaxID=2721561 RepID=UPI00142F8F5B|nr:3-oxoadipate enol-lactonase [Phaeobacter sp. HF9A]NIZ14588.1 3-oxoadipate enol-lactonase [Phaeobacter sp. HF9A]